LHIVITKRIRIIALWSTLFVFVALIVAFFFPLPPHGRFSTPDVDNTADAYLELSDGKVTWVYFGGERNREGEEFRRVMGEYHKEHRGWVFVNTSGKTAQLSATLLSLTIVYDNGDRYGPCYRYEIYKGR
jgi:hypothetical protein